MLVPSSEAFARGSACTDRFDVQWILHLGHASLRTVRPGPRDPHVPQRIPPMSATLAAPMPQPARPARPAALAHAAVTPSRRARWAGRAVAAPAVLLMAFSGVIKLVGAAPAVAGTLQLGFARHHVVPLAVLELGCLALYLVPRTAAAGALLCTAFLGGAVAVHLRLDDPLVTHTVFPAVMGALLWGGLYLRDGRVRAAARALLGRTESSRA